MKKVAILGAGAWGTALAMACVGAGCEVVLWSHNPDVAKSINKSRVNKKYLPGIKLPKEIKAVSALDDILSCDIFILAIPSQKLRENFENLAKLKISKDIPFILCCKGIEIGSLKLMSEISKEFFPKNTIAVLSGPNFAAEIARGLPACATIACENKKVGMELCEILGSQFFRLYYGEDIIGAQVGGAVKNVIAIACGIAIGKGFGENTRAAIVTRGIAEISRLCVAKGGKAETLMGLTGIGDIMLTCGSLASRNMSLGFELGKGASLKMLLANRQSVVEGVYTAESVVELAAKLHVDMPISHAVYAILHKGANIDKTVKELLNRPLGKE